MSEDVSQQAQPQGRTLRVRVFGDTADEIEMAALDRAREFFGDGPVLEGVRSYQVMVCVTGNEVATGKRYVASVEVRTIAHGGQG